MQRKTTLLATLLAGMLFWNTSAASGQEFNPGGPHYDLAGYQGSTKDQVKELLLRIILRTLLKLTEDQSSPTGSDPSSQPGPQPWPDGGGGGDGGGIETSSGGSTTTLPFALSRQALQYNANPVKAIAGRWKSNFGQVTLRQQGSLVDGEVRFQDGSTGRLRGQYQNGMLTLEYRHDSVASSRGRAVFMLQGSNRRFDGVIKNSVSGKRSEFWLAR